jgi:signal transduction histidine kinase
VSELPPESAEELYEHAPCGYVSTLPDATIVRVNRTLSSWIASAPEAIVGKKLHDLLTVPGRIYCETHLLPLLRLQGFVNEVALELARPGSEPLSVLVNAVQKRDERGEPIVNRILMFDVSERRRYERELLVERRRAERAAKEKADLLAMIGHDMRTPLSTITTAVDLLARLSPGEQQARYLGILRSASVSLLDLATRILEYSLIQSGKVVVNAVPFDPRALLQQVANVVSPAAEKKGLKLEIAADAALPAEVVGDAARIRQVLSNLAGNAVKFTSSGSVSIRVASPRRNLVEFEVRDTGIGIPRDRLAAIFEEFTQASSDIGRQYGGTGLGLTISRRLVELLGGRLAVESHEGEGSRFWFRLPLREAEPR